MSIRTIFISTFFLLSATLVLGADYKLVFQKSIPVENGYFTTDPIGNIYVVRNNNFIVKYNAAGDSLAVHNDVRYGRVSSIDATNPLRVLVFYSGFSLIKILDNLLSEKNSLDLRQIGLFNIPAVANSMDGNIWIYDPVGELKKIDENLEVRFSYPLRNMIDFVINPCGLVEQDRTLYMSDSLEGILVFDRFGFYKTVFPFTTREAVVVINNYIVYYKNGQLISYDQKSLRESKIDLPQIEDVINARLVKNEIYILRKTSLDIYILEQ